MKRYTRHSKAQWQQLISNQQASGLTQKVFCQQEELSITSFSKWRRKLKAETGSALPVSKIAPPPADAWIELPAELPATPSWHIELDLGNGVCLRLNQTG